MRWTPEFVAEAKTRRAANVALAAKPNHERKTKTGNTNRKRERQTGDAVTLLS